MTLLPKNNVRLYSLFVVVGIVGALLSRLGSVVTSFSAFEYIFFALVVAGCVFIAQDCLSIKSYENAFIFKNKFHLNVFSYIASFGFFFNFVAKCVEVYVTFTGENISVADTVSLFMSSALSLVTSVYFVMVGMSFSGLNYDFRKLGLFNIVPVFWAGAEIFSLIGDNSGFEKGIDSLLEYSSMIALILFFYRFAREVEDGGSSKNTTLLSARLFSYLSSLYFVDRLILTLSLKADLLSIENAAAVLLLTVCGFVFFFEKNILYNSNNSNTEI